MTTATVAMTSMIATIATTDGRFSYFEMHSSQPFIPNSSSLERGGSEMMSWRMRDGTYSPSDASFIQRRNNNNNDDDDGDANDSSADRSFEAVSFLRY